MAYDGRAGGFPVLRRDRCTSGTPFTTRETVTKFLIASVLALTLAGCTSPDRSQQVLVDAGYSNVRTGGYSWLGCGKGDIYATNFEAVGPTGRPVKGTVCSGFFKGATIRFN
jgi:hypothetical protein